MNNLYKFGAKEGYERIVTPENSELKYLGFDRILLPAGGKLAHEVEGRELVMILQKGDFTASVECTSGTGLGPVSGSRQCVFDGLPTALYVPPSSRLSIETGGGMEARVYSAVCDEPGDACFISSKDAPEVVKGAVNWKRKLRVLFGPQSVTKRLIVGESVSMPGGWIGFPPHKHDTMSDAEYPLDEIYSYQVQGPHGAYALQHTYDLASGTDEHYTIDGNDYAVAMPRGYHTTVAVPGCRFYLLWGLAGDKKVYKLTTDPRFSWLLDAEALFPAV